MSLSSERVQLNILLRGVRSRETATRGRTSFIVLKRGGISSDTDANANDGFGDWAVLGTAPSALARAHHTKLTLCRVLPVYGEKKIQSLLVVLPGTNVSTIERINYISTLNCHYVFEQSATQLCLSDHN